jgi:hypothetical protein
LVYAANLQLISQIKEFSEEILTFARRFMPTASFLAVTQSDPK